MKTCKFAATTFLLTLLVGCQSSSWKTALSSRFGRDKPSKMATEKDDAADDVQLVAGDKLNSSGRYRGRRSSDNTSVADTRGSARDVNVALKNGHQAEEGGQIKQAKMFYRQALDSDPKNHLAHHRLAIIADKEGEFRQAEEHYLNALKVKRGDPNLLSDLGYSFLLQNRRNESKYYLQKALEADPSHLRALNNLGLLEARQGNYDGALAAFRKTGTESDAQAKISELFPKGRPEGINSQSAGDSTFAGIRQQLPQVTPANGPGPWEQDATNSRIQTVGGIPSAPSIQPSPSAKPFPDIVDRRQPGQVAGANDFHRPQNGYNSDFAQNNLPQAKSFPPEPPRSAGSLPLDSGQPVAEQFPSLPLFPQPTEGRNTPNRQNDFPNAPDPTRLAGEFGAVNQQQSLPYQQNSPAQKSVAAPPANNPAFNSGHQNNGNYGQPAAHPQVDPRQQAAMMGLNAGLSNAFPVMQGGQSQQPANQSPTGNAPAAAAPFQNQPPYPANPMNSAPPFPTQTTGQLDRPTSAFPSQSYPQTGAVDSRIRTAARPVSQPAQNVYQQQPGQPTQPGYQPSQQQFQPGRQYQPPTQQLPGNGAYGQPQSQQFQQYPAQQQQTPAPQYNPQPNTTQSYPAQQYPGNYRTSPNTTTPQQFNPGNTYPQGR